ncbi:MAG: hypothetical protein ACPGJF_07635 [Sinimarinibacterium flocculans]|uniref:hypothetical protein n=1 Tax=Sinimarinibacterium flocculans TaxID=985250 RepID=UPI003C51A836
MSYKSVHYHNFFSPTFVPAAGICHQPGGVHPIGNVHRKKGIPPIQSAVLALATLLPHSGAAASSDLLQSHTPSKPKEVVTERRLVENDPLKRYFLIRRSDAAEGSLGLVVFVPGGQGGESSLVFAQNLVRYFLPGNTLLAHLVAPRWAAEQRIVWPTTFVRTPGMKFTTPEFIGDVVDDLLDTYPIDRGRVFAIGGSSSGPATIESAVTNPAITGLIVSASVFRPRLFPSMAGIAGKPVFLYYSRQDHLVPYDDGLLLEAVLGHYGAAVHLRSHIYGHEGKDTAYAIREGIDWLDMHTASTPKP